MTSSADQAKWLLPGDAASGASPSGDANSNAQSDKERSEAPEPLRLLVVDDDQGMRMSIVRALRDFAVQVSEVDQLVRFELTEAATGQEALDIINESPPDIMLLDQKMPDIPGITVLERLLEAGADTVTIMITAYASIANIVAATKRGAHDFLAKPFTPSELRTVIRKATASQVLARQARRLREERRAVRFELIRVLGHELRAPLNAIEGYLELLQDPERAKDNEFLQQCIQRGLFRIEGMRKLIDDLLDMTRIESGRKTRNLSKVDVREVAVEIIENWAPKADGAGLTVELHADAPAVMTADRGEIEMLLNNLVSNAIKYNAEGGRVDVTVGKQDDEVTVAVADTGIGMSEDELSRLFGEFVRMKNEKTRNIAGSGLGLSIVRKLATLYDGRVDVKSAPDQGSAFTVVLTDSQGEEAPS